MSEHELWNELGNLYFLCGEYDQAVFAYHRSIEMDRSFGRPYSNLALAYVQQGKYDEAVELYQRSIELLVDRKDKAISWNKLGNVHRHLKNYQKAVIAYQLADELDPESHDGRGEPGQLLYASSEVPAPLTESSPPQLESATPADQGPVFDVDPGAVSAPTEEPAGPAEPLSDPEAGLSEPTDAFDVEPILAWATPDLIEDPNPGIQYAQEFNEENPEAAAFPDQPAGGWPAEILDLTEEGLNWEAGPLGGSDIVPDEIGPTPSTDPDETEPANHWSDPLAPQNGSGPEMSVEGWQPLTFYVAPDPTEPFNPVTAAVDNDFHMPKAEGRGRKPKDTEVEIARFKRVVQINHRNAFAWDTLGTLYKSSNRYQEAILAYQEAISINPAKAFYHYHLGLAYAADGREEDAITAFQTVIELDPDYSLAHATLGGYYRKMGLEELAQQHLGKAMKNIFDSENEYNRACLEAICGNADQAIELLRVALINKQTYVDWVLRDPDLDFIRQDSRFKQLISEFTN